MNVYNWRSIFKTTISNQNSMVFGKLAFKTKNQHWVNTKEPVICIVSIHSSIHEGINGDLKMAALMSTIKTHVDGKITVLLAERAHAQVVSLKYQNNLERAFDECLITAQTLENRYRTFFEDCQVEYWSSFINEDEHYIPSLNFLRGLYHTDPNFRKCVNEDAEATYTKQRMEEFPDKALFVEKAFEDVLEHCASWMVIAKKGYRFHFYPGSPFNSTEYINEVYLPSDKQMSWIDVFLSIEKKKYH